jgi:catechol 2,3-dioxygenase-like lactoylglutathione lyase family enzyme
MALTHLLIVSDIQRSVRFYRDVLGATVVREGEPSILRVGNGWLILNVGGGPTPDKPDVTMTPPDGSANVTSALNIRVADLAAVYRAWSGRGARFLTEPVDFGWEIRCYLRDPDGHLIEVGQTAAALSRRAGQPVPVRSLTASVQVAPRRAAGPGTHAPPPWPDTPASSPRSCGNAQTEPDRPQ